MSKSAKWEKLNIKSVKQGDLIRSKVNDISYIVYARYGDRITAVRTVDITNEDEWEVLNEK